MQLKCFLDEKCNSSVNSPSLFLLFNGEFNTERSSLNTSNWLRLFAHLAFSTSSYFPRNSLLSIYFQLSAAVTCIVFFDSDFARTVFHPVSTNFIRRVCSISAFFRFRPCLSRFESEVEMLSNGGYRNLKNKNFDFLWILFFNCRRLFEKNSSLLSLEVDILRVSLECSFLSLVSSGRIAAYFHSF